MFKHSMKKGLLDLQFETSELSAPQIRLLKSLNLSLVELMTAKSEQDFFEKSREVFKLAGMAVKNAHFSEKLKGSGNIPYAQQAIEFSVDDLFESKISSPNKISGLDN